MKIRSLSVSLALLATLATCSSQAYAEEAYCAPVKAIMDDLEGYELVTVAKTQDSGGPSLCWREAYCTRGRQKTTSRQ